MLLWPAWLCTLQGKAASRKVQLDNAFLLQTFLANSRDLVKGCTYNQRWYVFIYTSILLHTCLPEAGMGIWDSVCLVLWWTSKRCAGSRGHDGEASRDTGGNWCQEWKVGTHVRYIVAQKGLWSIIFYRFDHLASLAKQVSPSRDRGGEEVLERAQQLMTERQALKDAWEKRNKKLKQCCELQVLDNSMPTTCIFHKNYLPWYLNPQHMGYQTYALPT